MITISRQHRGKMEGIHAINTSSLSNPFCNRMAKAQGTVCEKCYARQAMSYRPILRRIYQDNGDLLSSRKLSIREIPIIEDRIFRFHSFGELLNDVHYENLWTIAAYNPQTMFALWTKRPELTFKAPDNMVLIYSNPYVDGEPLIPEYFDKCFTVITDESKVNCRGRCIDCRMCYSRKTHGFIYTLIKSKEEGRI